MLNPRFCEYFQSCFFADDPSGFEDFIHALEQPLPRSIRIKPNITTEVISRLEKDGWILMPTAIDRMYTVGRRKDFDPHERRLGMSIDHLAGNLYIQELAAAHPVDLLADGAVHQDAFLILDMASSP